MFGSDLSRISALKGKNAEWVLQTKQLQPIFVSRVRFWQGILQIFKVWSTPCQNRTLETKIGRSCLVCDTHRAFSPVIVKLVHKYLIDRTNTLLR